MKKYLERWTTYKPRLFKSPEERMSKPTVLPRPH